MFLAALLDEWRYFTLNVRWNGTASRMVSSSVVLPSSEPIPILWENLLDDEEPPALRYICECEATDSRHQAACLPSCLCTDCSTSSACACLGRRSAAYDESGRLRCLVDPAAADEDASVVIECTSACACWPNCSNSVVSRGLTTPLQVFKTLNRGWAVRTLSSLPIGAFVCEYAGELISSEQTRRRLKRRRAEAAEAETCRGGGAYVKNYVMTVREHLISGRVLRTTIDPTEVGNVARFINHACRPNLVQHLVRVGSLVPRVALFACREIASGEELTMYYGDYHVAAASSEPPPSRTSGGPCGGPAVGMTAGMTRCLCGEVCCRGFLPFDSDATIDDEDHADEP